jgi:dipeptidyl aminopeptidase/acylaminoacyl peptidase
MTNVRPATGLVLWISLLLATPARSIELQVYGCPPFTWGGTSQPSWSPGGEYIAYIWDNSPDPTRYGGSTLRAMDFSCATPAWLPMSPLAGTSSREGLIGLPAWSPDGKRIAYYYSEGSGGASGIWTVGESNPPTLLLSRPDVGPISCDWSPAGDAIAFTEQDNLWLLTVQTGATRLLTTLASDPSWSPDGHSIVFTSTRSGNYDLWVLDLATSAVRQLTADPASDRSPDWSPNGRWIAFSSHRGEHSDLWVIPASGGGAVQLTNDEDMDSQPTWSPSGDRIAFWSSRAHPSLWMGGIWIASQLPTALTEVAPRSWSGLKDSFR